MNARVAVIAVVGMGLVLSASVRAAEEKKRATIDSRMPFVHRIPLLNEDGTAINPTKDTVPYSPAATCGKCHDYATINQGWHFNAKQPNVPAGRPGEPWLMLDPTTRTQLPLSYRGWAGTFRPADVGMSDWQFVKTFARHMPGGGVGETPTTQPADPKAYWPLSGKLQNDCMICHDGGNNYSTADRELQFKQMNFKLMPTRSLGLGKISGSVATIVEEAEGEGTDPLKSKQTAKVAWDSNKFDPEMRVTFNITRNTPSSKCYYCHTTNVVGATQPQRWHSDKDVHLAAGLSCVDCHRHGMDHDVVRGYESEGEEARNKSIAAYSCRGCHLGVEGSPTAPVALGGKLGSPRPEHKGLPPIHLEKLACTTCHSGPWPSDTPVTLQTSFAHELGLESFHRTPQDQPRILAPVFLRGVDGKIAPNKVVWPNYWGRLQGEKVTPIPPANVKKVAKGELPNVKETDENAWTALSEEKIGKVLAALAAVKEEGEPVYVSGGLLYRRSADGKLTSAEHAAAKPYAWAMAHDVRPASQALGSRGCADCHSADSPIYFGQVMAQGPVTQQTALSKAMFELRGDNGLLAWLFALSFYFRTMLKVISFGSATILTGLLAMYGLRGLSWVSSRLR
ncbi:MAG TPA: multiheme c-type cytochrome [Tepidisphaeraceae bacterium]|nr:multiheme c-type cytochrome [Tepidisphaeraceae bacterium]